jgi:hypothetical protein
MENDRLLLMEYSASIRIRNENNNRKRNILKGSGEKR